MLRSRISLSEKGSTSEEVTPTESTSQQRGRGMISWICSLALYFCLVFFVILMFLVMLAAVIVRLFPKWVLEIAVFVSVASWGVSSLYCVIPKDSKNLLERILLKLWRFIAVISTIQPLLSGQLPQPQSPLANLVDLSLKSILWCFGVTMLATEVLSITSMPLKKRNTTLPRSSEMIKEFLGYNKYFKNSILPSVFAIAKIALRTVYVLAPWMLQIPSVLEFFPSIMQVTVSDFVIVSIIVGMTLESPLLKDLYSSMEKMLSAVTFKLIHVLLAILTRRPKRKAGNSETSELISKLSSSPPQTIILKDDFAEDIDKNASSSYSPMAPPEEVPLTDNIVTTPPLATVAIPKKIAYATGIGFTTEEGEKKKISNEADLGESIGVGQVREGYMRECLLYCSLFPADYEFSRDTLIWSWLAAGLINSEQSSEMELMAIKCFDRLIRSKYILESGYDHLSDQMKYTVEFDKFSFLNKQPSVQIKYRNMLGNDTDMTKVEHLSLIFEQINQIQLECIQKCTCLKTLLLHKCWGSEFQTLLHDLFLNLKFLTSLDLSDTNIEELPSSIENLTMLRYLDMSRTPIRLLPESIVSLTCLETLILLRCLSLCGLPQCMNKLVKLQHLVLDLALLLQSMPIGVGNLMDLQTFGTFVVGTNDGNRIVELKNINKLKGSLCLMKLENILNVDEAREARLYDKQYLSKLEFIWSDLQDAWVPMEEKVLEYLKPHFGLQELQIIYYSGGMLPSWICDPSFTQLFSITLYGCRYCERLSTLGRLPCLKALKIVKMDELVAIDKLFCQTQDSQDQQAFPKLERLSLERLSKLETWTGVEDGHFQRLQQLLIKYCPKLAALPTLSYLISLQHLEICNCPALSCLPKGGLPNSLQYLMLKECPKLKERCHKEHGEDWANVACVPTLAD